MIPRYQGFDTTILQRLSAILPAESHYKIDRLTNTQIFSAMMLLSGAPLHPWERLKWEYFGDDYKFPTIEEIEPAPITFDSAHCSCCLSAIGNDYNQTLISQTSALTTIPLTGIQMEMDPEHIKKSITFIEVIKTMTPEIIETRPIETAQKVVNYYLKLFSKS